MISWSIKKYVYLQEIRSKGVNLIPSVFIVSEEDVKNQRQSIEKLIKENKCSNVIVKPGVGASAKYCERFDVVDLDKIVAFVDELLKTQPVIIQPYMKSIESGERSLLYVDRKFQHAAMKVPKTGDYRCQSEYGGSRERFTPSKEELEFGQSVIDCVGDFLYGRVDYLLQDDKFYLMEFELDSPYLYGEINPNIFESFVDAVISKMNK
jgi:glutathione synthase/RimK-type ligase-like ATP-grasp enzyme